MKLKVLQDFTYWHGGCRRADYVAGSEIDTDDAEMAEFAKTEGWAAADDAQQESAEQAAATQEEKKPGTAKK